FTLTLGISTATDTTLGLLDRLFFDTTVNSSGVPASGVQITASANAGYDLDGDGNADTTPLNFSAGIGPLQLDIINGRGLSRMTVTGALRDGTTDNSGDHRLTFQELGTQVAAGNFDHVVGGSFTGDAQAIIPIDGNGDGVIDISSTNAPD